jgi:hypothetical protein
MKFFIKKLDVTRVSYTQYHGVMQFGFHLGENDEFNISDIESILNRELNKKDEVIDWKKVAHEMNRQLADTHEMRPKSTLEIKEDKKPKTKTEEIGEALRQAGKALSEARPTADDFRTILEQVPNLYEARRALLRSSGNEERKKHHTCLDAGEVWLEALKTSIDASMDGELDVAIEEADKTLDEFKKRFDV